MTKNLIQLFLVGCLILVTTSTLTKNLDVSTMTSDIGIKIKGDGPKGLFGMNLNNAGDMNNDGIPDFMIAAPGNPSTQGEEEEAFITPGSVYVVYGKAGGLPEGLDFTTDLPTAEEGFKVTSSDTTSMQWIGTSLAAGDFNGDGHGDIAIGAPLADNEEGAVYIIFGPVKANEIDVSTLSSTGKGIKISGKGEPLFGLAIASVGDINGDGATDLAIRASLEDDGVVYIIQSKELTSDISIADLATVKITGTGFYTNKFTPVGGLLAVLSQDDAGLSYLAIPSNLQEENDSYIVGYILYLGSEMSTNIDLTALKPTQGFKLKVSENVVSVEFNSAGDLNHDGIDDIIIGCGENKRAVAVYIKKGLEIEDVLTPGDNGFTLTLDVQGDGALGITGTELGDFNGDNIDDFIIMAWANNDFISFILLGQERGMTDITLSLDTDLDSSVGWMIRGDTRLGLSSAHLYDVNQDGHRDMALSGNNGVYVIYGSGYIPSSTKSNKKVIILSAVLGGAFVLLVGAALVLCKMQRKKFQSRAKNTKYDMTSPTSTESKLAYKEASPTIPTQTIDV